jgi:hypothetical protein
MYYHMKKHVGALDHVCSVPGCGKRFVHKSGLNQHVSQAHAVGEPDLACPCCDHRCRTKANLLIHVARKHGDGWIPARNGDGCAGCSRTFASDTAYYYHAFQCFDAAIPETVRGLNTGDIKKC